jgi:hypothetical protein
VLLAHETGHETQEQQGNSTFYLIFCTIKVASALSCDNYFTYTKVISL